MKKVKYKKAKFCIRFVFLIAVFILLIVKNISHALAAEEKISVHISAKSVKIGEVLQITSSSSELTYSSSDVFVAYVNKKGTVIGKKAGNAIISVEKNGNQVKKFKIQVIANGKKPEVIVTPDEILILKEKINQKNKLQVKVKNMAKASSDKATVKLVYQIEGSREINTVNNDNLSLPEDISYDNTLVTGSAVSASAIAENDENRENIEDPTGTFADAPISDSEFISEDESTENDNYQETQKETISQKVEITIKNLKYGKQKNGSIKTINDSYTIDKVQLKKIVVFSGNAKMSYNVSENSYTYGWGPDTEPPVIKTIFDGSSYKCNETVMTIYPDKEYHFKKYVTVSDNRNKKVKLSVDTSKVNNKKEGNYKIRFIAEDSAGNQTVKKIRVHMSPVKYVSKMADEVLGKIVKDRWSNKKKIKEVYKYLRKNFSYVSTSDKSSWEKAAENGLKYKRGDCFSYYAMARLLLTRLGIPNLMVMKEGGRGHHYWNLVYVKGGWYHFDATPRRVRATFCLLTDAQLLEYSRKAGNSHVWVKSKYPMVATKAIGRVKWGKRY